MADNRAGIHSKPRNRRLYAVTETTFGTQVKPAATDAFRAVTGAIESPSDHRIERDDNRPSRSLEAQITGSIPPVPWSYECYVIPSGTAGTPPDVHALLLAALGTDSYTNTPATSDAYALTDTALNRGSLSLYEMYPAGNSGDSDCVHTEALFGAIVSTLSISGNAGEPPRITFGGVGSQYAFTGRTACNGDPGGGTSLVVDNGNMLMPGSIVAFYEEADGTTLVDDGTSNNGVIISAVSGNTATAAETIAAGVDDNDIVAPFSIGETVAGNALPGIQGSMTVEGTSVSALGFEVNLDNGDAPHESEAFRTWAMSGYYEGKRRVTGQFTYKAKASDLSVLAQRSQYGNITIALALGTTAGSILTVAVEAEMSFASIEKPDDNVCVCTCPFKGVATSANAKDELKLTWT